MSYTENRHPSLDSLNIERCYLCGKELESDSTLDHIIPTASGQIFAVGSGSKPCLPVHRACNALKSKDDEFYIRHIQLACSNHPDAGKSFAHFLDKATAEKPNAYLVGTSATVRNYKLAKSLIDADRPALLVRQGNEELPNVPLKKENVQRVEQYVQTMCRGLFIRNVRGCWPGVPRLAWMQYRRGAIEGKYEAFTQGVQEMIRAGGASVFSQHWPGRVFYAGCALPENQDLGFIFLELFGEVGYFAVFQQEKHA